MRQYKKKKPTSKRMESENELSTDDFRFGLSVSYRFHFGTEEILRIESKMRLSKNTGRASTKKKMPSSKRMESENDFRPIF